MKLFISPHNDDETLFGAFTIMKEQCGVLVVFDSYVQVARGNRNATAERRRNETQEAVWQLLTASYCTVPPAQLSPVQFLGLRDDLPEDRLQYHLSQLRSDYTAIICPAWEQDGHEQHNEVARVCRDLWPAEQRTEYLTYTRTRGRSRGLHTIENGQQVWYKGIEVIPTPDMIARKHRALACYTSQMEVENCRDWFMGDIREYILPPASGGVKP